MKMNHKYAFSEYVKKCHETVKIKTIKKSWKNMENVFFFLQKFMGISLNCKILCVVKRRGENIWKKVTRKILKLCS